MTETKRTAYRLFAETVLLLMVYAALALLNAVKLLPQDPLATALTGYRLNTLSASVLNLAVMTGLLGSGIHIVAGETETDRLRHERWLIYTFRLWTGLLVVAIVAGILGQTVDTARLIDAIQVVILGMFLTNTIRSLRRRSPIPLVWLAGMVLSGLCILAGWIAGNGIFHTLATNLAINVAYVLAAVALGFWLMSRFSRMPQLWIETGVYSVAGLTAVAGILISFAAVHLQGAPELVGTVALFFAPAAYLIFAAHSHKGLSEHNSARTLAAHWYGLAVLLFLLGGGVLGGLLSLPRIGQWTQGTHLAEAQIWLVQMAVVAIILGTINQASAELRGENRRVTGLIPFWLMTFGFIGGGLALSIAGTVQIYLARVSGIDYVAAQELLTPLYILWILSVLSLAMGILTYALGFWARRPAVWDESAR